MLVLSYCGLFLFLADEPSEEIGDNLKDLEIPDDIQEKFRKDDEIEKQQSALEQQQKEQLMNVSVKK